MFNPWPFCHCMSFHQRLGIAYLKASWRELGLKLSLCNAGMILYMWDMWDWRHYLEYNKCVPVISSNTVVPNTFFWIPWELEPLSWNLYCRSQFQRYPPNCFIFVAPSFPCIFGVWCPANGRYMPWPWGERRHRYTCWFTFEPTGSLKLWYPQQLSNILPTRQAEHTRALHRMQVHPAHWTKANGFYGSFKF